MARARKRHVQQSFEYRTHGGKRRGAGRKPRVAGKPGSPHRKRGEIDPRHPQLITLRACPEVPNLRRRRVWQAVFYALAVTAARDDFRVVHVSIQGNHVHLLVEADSQRALSKGMQGFQVSVAKQINHRLKRRGQVFADRFHARALRTPTEVKHALRYALSNARRHGIRFAGRFDPYSTAHQFGGWRECPDRIVDLAREAILPTKFATTWLLAHGWKRVPLSSAFEVPG